MAEQVTSIQSLVMSDDVYYNEPGHESQMGTKSGEANNRGYNFCVRCVRRHACVRVSAVRGVVSTRAGAASHANPKW